MDIKQNEQNPIRKGFFSGISEPPGRDEKRSSAAVRASFKGKEHEAVAVLDW
jgi:hypothetical protein